MKRPVVVIVDAYFNGALLAPEFIQRGYDCVHVMSTTHCSPAWLTTFRRDDFKDALFFQGSLEVLAAELQPYQPVIVLPGAEMGVELADRLSEHLGLKTNGTELSPARRNKYLQIETITKQGLLAPRQGTASSLEEALSLARSFSSWPVVIKPLSSSGTEMVSLCRNEQEIRQALESTLGKTTITGQRNMQMLVQSFLKGTEYVVDTLSAQGQHRVTAVWRYDKATLGDAAFIYRQTELLAPDAEHAAVLSAYGLRVLDALAIKHGPTHQEIMLTPEGPALVECNARIAGLRMPQLWEAATGVSLVGLIAEAYEHPDRFLARPQPLCRLRKRGRILSISNPYDHCILNRSALEAIEALPSFLSLRLYRKAEDTFPRTMDLITSVGTVQLAHEDPAVLEHDTETIRVLESHHLLLEVAVPAPRAEEPSPLRAPIGGDLAQDGS